MNDIDVLISLLPACFQEDIDQDRLLEIVIDLGRPLEYRYPDGNLRYEDVIVDQNFLQNVLQKVNQFGPDNRAGLDGTLHRISRIVDRYHTPVGLTCRVGRSIPGTAVLVQDILEQPYNHLLLLGPPGAGKTTLLRDIARHMSTEMSRNVVIVDTSNEIAGDGSIPHPAIGYARRLQVPLNRTQADIMIEAVENHMPHVIIVDEISTNMESLACQTIARRGVTVIATAHGCTLKDIVNNPPILKLIGGVKTVTIGDDQAARNGTSKTIQEREMESVFKTIVELENYSKARVHKNVDAAVDAMLRGEEYLPEYRQLTTDNRVVVLQAAQKPQIEEKDEFEVKLGASFKMKKTTK